MIRPSKPRLAAALLSCALALAGCGNKSERIAAHLADGDAYARKADWDKAGLEVRNVLQMDPKNARAYYLGGQVEEGRHEAQRAYGYYYKAVELDPGYADAKTGMARLYMLAGDDARAGKLVADVLAAHPDHLGARTLDAALTARRGDNAAAVAAAQRILSDAKTIPAEPSLLLAGLYANERRYGDALAIIESALKQEPRNATLLAVAAQLCGAQAMRPEMAAKAVGYYQAATDAAPKNNDLWNAWALYLAGRNELDAAEKVLRDAMAQQPDDGKRVLALLDLLTQRRGVAVAEREYLQQIDARPKDMGLRFGLAQLYDSARRSDDAERVLRDVIRLAGDAPAGLGARDRLAAHRVAAGDLVEARALIDAVLKANPRDGSALLQRGRLLIGEGRAREAILDLRAAVKDQPGAPDVVGALAAAHRLAHEPELAREVLADAVKFKPENPELRLLLAADMADAGDGRSATDELDETIRLQPRDARAYDLKARLQTARRDVDGAEQTLRAYVAATPGQPDALLRLGQFYADHGKPELALQQYDKAADVAPGLAQPVVSAVGVLVGQHRESVAQARIDAMLKTRPDNPVALQLRGELALAAKDWPLATESFRKVVALAPQAPQSYQNLGRVMMARDDAAGALAVLDQGIRANPADLTLPALRADWLLRSGRTDDAIAAYEALLKRSPGDDGYANNLAFLLAEVKRDPASLTRALGLTQRFAESDNAGYLDSLGWVHYRLAQYDKATPLLERAVRRAPDAPLLQLHLGMALCKGGDAARGKTLIEKALQANAGLAGADEARKLAEAA